MRVRGAAAQLGIEIAQWFVHQKDIRLTRHGSPEGHPLFLTTGQLLGSSIQQLIQFEGAGNLQHPMFHPLFPFRSDLKQARQLTCAAMQLVMKLLRGAAAVAATQSEPKVVANAEMGIERVALEHHCHIPLGWPQPGHRLLPHQDFTGTGGLKACHQSEQGAFPAAGRTDQHQKLTILNRQ